MLQALVLAAQALVVLHRPEDLGAEQAVAFRLEGAVVDRFRLLDLAERPRPDQVRRGEPDLDRVEVSRPGLLLERFWKGLPFGELVLLALRPDARSMLMPSERDFLTSTLNDSGMRPSRGCRRRCLYIAVAAGDVVRLDREHLLQGVRGAVRLERPHSISPKRWPPNCALPPSGCCVTSECGPVERACILSSTRWFSFSMYM